MSGGGPSPPTAYDPYAVTSGQTNLNTQAASQSQGYNLASAAQTADYANKAAAASLQANAMNQSNPFGSLTYNQIGTGANGIPIYSATSSLSPTEQALFSSYTGGQRGLGSAADALIAATGGQYSSAPDLTGTTNSLTSNMLANEVASLSPFFKTQQDALTSQLASEGVAPTQGGGNGTVNPAWAAAEQSLQGNQNQAISGFLASAQPQAFQEALTSYETPLNNILTMLGASTPTTYNAGAVSTPTTNVNSPIVGAATVAPANLEGAITQAENQQQQIYADQMAQQSSMLSGLFGIGAAGVGGLARSGGLGSLGGLFGGGGSSAADYAGGYGLDSLGFFA